MSEAHWVAGALEINFSHTTWLAQIFMPTWSHDCWEIRINAKILTVFAAAHVSIQYCPDGLHPSGVPISEILLYPDPKQGLNVMQTFQVKIPEVRLVQGIYYAMVIKLVGIIPFVPAMTSYVPPPTGYTKGRLIRSTDSGTTWNLTNLGSLLFAEFGNPPLAVTEFVAPIKNWTIQSLERVDYFVST